MFLGWHAEGQVQACCDNMPSRFGSVSPVAPEGMIWIPGYLCDGGAVASFMKSWPVSARSRPDERPVHPVELDGFWMSRTPVTNAEFREFIEKTGYITTAEKAPELEEIMKGLPPGAARLQPRNYWFRLRWFLRHRKGKYHCKMYCSGGGGRRARIGVIPKGREVPLQIEWIIQWCKSHIMMRRHMLIGKE